ncbi:unnamed protein product [Brachionus calyciflorus]|uniref:Uncharacterized protein n=1 Tax=Brachionus calyciflorus TaxID=104777 RepID=A0A813M5J0_9BILA|nr:unnamed protein product [Brachionus calyciflorus]
MMNFQKLLVKKFLEISIVNSKNINPKILVRPMSSKTGERFVFHGTNANPVFQMESGVDLPVLKDGEVLVKVRAATICLSDIHTVCGTRIEPTPSVLGHEACVEIVSHKRNNFDLNIGDRATFSIADTCGTCEFCTNDLSQKCVKLFKYGHAAMSSGSGFNGCYATHIIIRSGTEVIKLPHEISDGLAATINCALATMVNCVDQLPDNVKRSRKKALIQGDGMLGLYGCALLKELGFEKVYCSGNKKIRDDLVMGFGGIPIIDEVKELENETNKFDCVIEACGSPEVVQNGIRLLKPGGAYIFVGMVHPKSGLNITGEQLIRKCLTLKGIHNYQGYHLKKSVEFLKNTINKYPYQSLISPNVFSLNNLPDAINMAISKVYPRICVKP